MILPSYIGIPLGVLFFNGAIALNYYNNRKDALNGHINHSKALKIKILSCIPVILSFALCTNSKFGWSLLISTFLVASWFYFIFDGIWGIAISNDWWYRGTATGKNQAFSDKMVKSWPQWEYILLKLALVGSSTYLYGKLF